METPPPPAGHGTDPAPILTPPQLPPTPPTAAKHAQKSADPASRQSPALPHPMPQPISIPIFCLHPGIPGLRNAFPPRNKKWQTLLSPALSVECGSGRRSSSRLRQTRKLSFHLKPQLGQR